MNNIPQEIKDAREARRCKGDDCDLNHCPGCGAHTLGYLEPFQRCSTCELEREFMVEAEVNRANDQRHQRRMEASAIEGEVMAAQYDNDPNPYEGTYSEQ